MVIGKDAPLAPSCVRASGITSTSAVISWLPSNSNYQHVVCVNNVEIRTVKPGVYRHTITGNAFSKLFFFGFFTIFQPLYKIIVMTKHSMVITCVCIHF